MNLTSYSKILHLGHRRNADLYQAALVWVEEKIDGSQFAFSKCAETGELMFRSKRAEVHDGDAGIFAAAVAAVKAREKLLRPGYVYRGEAMRGPKHNVLTYGRAPEGNVVIWDIEVAQGDFMGPTAREVEARRCGFEPVRVLGYRDGSEPLSACDCEHLLSHESQLGGTLIEGFVVKQHEIFDREGKLKLYKFVSEAFKEKHKKAPNPGGYNKKTNVLDALKAELAHEGRWRKALQRLMEAGECTGTPKDIGKLIAYTKEDLAAEEQDYIAQRLYQSFSKEIIAGAVKGLPEWYKLELVSNPPTPTRSFL